MEQQKIIFISHCILNTASKVVRSVPVCKTAEEQVRKAFLSAAIQKEIQFIQLPCPEFTLYGAKRWGHTKEQFDNPFFREHCRVILTPILLQMKAYLQCPEQFRVLGVIGVEGSPSCGVSMTCSGEWGGEFSHRENLAQTLASVHTASAPGVLMDVLMQMMRENGISLPVVGLNPHAPQAIYDLLEDSRS